MFGFLALRFLQDCPKETINLEVGQSTHWIKNSALLVGTFYKKFVNVDYLPIFVFLMENFKSNDILLFYRKITKN